ncbi:MAG: hypothetical protein A4E38_00035 [Methanoregulaceae archaeon PtaB.Bin108]|nr:MAG: hypothetical protein A4E38_00035 [Methanoregulaceae archaeon PtaB.Bin108]
MRSPSGPFAEGTKVVRNAEDTYSGVTVSPVKGRYAVASPWVVAYWVSSAPRMSNPSFRNICVLGSEGSSKTTARVRPYIATLVLTFSLERWAVFPAVVKYGVTLYTSNP